MIAGGYISAETEIAPRRSIVSMSSAPHAGGSHWPILCDDALVVVDVAPRWSLVSMSSAPHAGGSHWPILCVEDVLVLVGGGVDDIGAEMAHGHSDVHILSKYLRPIAEDEVVEDFATGEFTLPPLRLLQTSVHFSPSEESASQGSKSESSSSESQSGAGRSSLPLSNL